MERDVSFMAICEQLHALKNASVEVIFVGLMLWHLTAVLDAVLECSCLLTADLRVFVTLVMRCCGTIVFATSRFLKFTFVSRINVRTLLI